MKLIDLYESIDFVPSFFDKEKNYQTTPMKKVERECVVCDGSAISPYDPDGKEACPDCKETPGRETSSEYDAPNINVSNRNAAIILQMLGVSRDDGEDYAGVIHNKDIPIIKRKLLMLKNKDDVRNQHTIEPTDTSSEKKTYIDKSGPTPEIKTRGGVRIIDDGLSDSRISNYIDKMLEILSFAQQKGWDVSWS